VAYALWIIQTLLGLLFLFSGSMKFVMSVAEMTKDMPAMPGWFLHFIGVMEILGGFGLILPSFLRIRPGLTPLAAACLVIIMSGATAITLGTMGIGRAMLPLIVGILCVFVAYGRWRVAPLSPRR
jgi:putative oxidoreductase